MKLVNRLRSRWEKFDDNTDFFKHNINLYYIIGFSLWTNTWRYRFYTAVATLTLTLFWIFIVWDLYKNPEFENLLENVNTSLVHLAGLLKFFLMVKNRHTFFQLIDFINGRSFCPNDVQAIVIRKAMFRQNFRLLLFLIVLGHFTLLTWFAFPLVEKNSGAKAYPMPQPMYIPIDFEHHNLVYWVVYLFICFAIYISSMLVGTGCLFLCSFMAYITSEFDVLATAFGKTATKARLCEPDLERTQTAIDDLKTNIVQHNILLKCAEDIQRILYVPMLFQLLSSGILLSMAGYQSLTIESFISIQFVTRLQYLAYNLLELFYYCSRGEQLRHASEKVGRKAYEWEWTDIRYTGQTAKQHKSVRAMVILTILRAQKPVIISAGGITSLSYETLMMIVKTSYSVLTLLINQRKG